MRKAALVLGVICITLRSGAGFGATFNVSASGMAFTPPTLTIAVGDSIKWTVGVGLQFHTTTSGTGSLDPQMGLLWDAPLDQTNTTFIHRFNSPGVFPYFCQFHEIMGMKGTITVNAAPLARDTAVTTAENTPVLARLQGFDPDGNPLTFAMLAGPFHGTPSGFNPTTGIFTYTPTASFFGADSIRYRANDGFANSNTAIMRITVTNGCNCPDQGDVVNNDAAVDVFDVIQEIGIAFSGGADVQDPGCPTTRGDVINNDAAVDVFDVIAEIGIAFSGGSATDPCAP